MNKKERERGNDAFTEMVNNAIDHSGGVVFF